MSPPAEAPAGPRDWPARFRAAISGGLIRTVYQPIVDLSRSRVVGYEALTRFEDPEGQGPEEWFAAAHRCRLDAELEAMALTSALAQRPSLPPDCFLTVNVAPGVLGAGPVRRVLEGEGDLAGVVIELTEQTPVESYAYLAERLDAYREAGALLAVDDVGSGYAGLQHLIHLRPSFIKLDRQFVDGIDQDGAKRALVEVLGTFTDRIDCWLLAEGVERPEELEVLTTLGVPLGQGYLLARPGPPWAGLRSEAAEQLGRHRPPTAGRPCGSSSRPPRPSRTAATSRPSSRRAPASRRRSSSTRAGG